jgi:glutathione S-transferase
MLRQLKSGRLDGVPTTIVDSYPNLTAFYNRMMDLPAIKAHYDKWPRIMMRGCGESGGRKWHGGRHRAALSR